MPSCEAIKLKNEELWYGTLRFLAQADNVVTFPHEKVCKINGARENW